MRIRIRVLIPLIIFVIAANAEKLTEKENEDRLKDCGKVDLPTCVPDCDVTADKMNEKHWIVRVHNKDPSNIKTFDSLGSFISRRHIITSAQPILNKKSDNDPTLWSKDGAQWDQKCDKAGYYDVPEKYVKNMEIVTENCAGKDSTCKKKSFQPVKAWILKLCALKRYDEKYAPMLIEVKESDMEFGCLSHQKTEWNWNRFHAFGIRYAEKDNPSSKSQLRDTTGGKIKGYDTEIVTVWRYEYPGDRGGPLILDISNKQTIIGIGATPGCECNRATEFFNVDYFQDDICFVAGICPPPETTPVPRTTTGPSTVTQTTPITTNTPLIPTNQPPGTVTPANPTTPRQTQPRTPETNRRPDIRGTREPDEDYTDPDYDKIEGGEDEDEEEEDFLVSADFLNGSGNMGLNFVMFAAVLAMVLVY